MSKRYQHSEAWLKQAESTIPLGSQTFSKSKVSYPYGVSPFFIERGEGCHVWDIDDNCYTDFVSGLLCVSLGYKDQDVDSAVKAQMDKGVTFSLPHKLEAEVAERLVELIPCAEQVRFGKNGTDVTSAAIRLARAYTGKNRVAVCGYHGWQDWYIGSTTRDKGVPDAVKALTHAFTYNDLASLETLLTQYHGEFAAVILEPMNLHYPELGFLEGIRALCDEHGIVLIFDEMITGFRFSLGGAQELFGVTPDLATFGKGLANGYPLSAVVGKKEIMQLMEEIFFSGTFGGETLSLAAAKAVLTKLQHQPILQHIHAQGEYLIDGLTAQLKDLGSPKWLEVCGHPSWSFLLVKDTESYSSYQLKSLLLQEMNAKGILLGGGHNLNFAHQREDIDAILSAYSTILPMLQQTIINRDFDARFNGKVLEPLFKVR